ncbi:MAG: hypothetical protein J6C59_10460 [Muribaculaceae bacterium]|nr:hypothetical protein [Muribaculaceae bacterium]
MKKIFTLLAALMLLACGSFTAQAGIFTDEVWYVDYTPYYSMTDSQLAAMADYDGNAATALGIRYLDTDDIDSATDYLFQGIELENADAMYTVAVIFLAGADGDEDAIMSGISYLSKAAQLGHADAEEMLLGILDEINGNE